MSISKNRRNKSPTRALRLNSPICAPNRATLLCGPLRSRCPWHILLLITSPDLVLREATEPRACHRVVGEVSRAASSVLSASPGNDGAVEAHGGGGGEAERGGLRAVTSLQRASEGGLAGVRTELPPEPQQQEVAGAVSNTRALGERRSRQRTPAGREWAPWISQGPPLTRSLDLEDRAQLLGCIYNKRAEYSNGLWNRCINRTSVVVAWPAPEVQLLAAVFS